MDEYLEGIMRKVQKYSSAQKGVDLDYAYQMGFDCGMNGANETNSHFAIFSNQEFTKAWERGKRDGELNRREPQSSKE